MSDNDTTVKEKERSARNEIVAPRIFNYQTLGSGWTNGPVQSAERAREWVRWAAANNIDGIKFFNRGDETPEIDAAAIDEAHKNKMGTVAHLSQNNVAMFNARQAGDAHLDTVTHYYGHFESLLKDKTIQDFPIGYDYNNEQDRFGDIARSDFVVSLPLLYKGTHYAHPKVTVTQGATVMAAPSGGTGARAVEIEADGEIVGALPARFRIRPAALTLLV